jgi:6-phosphogluconolactonase
MNAKSRKIRIFADADSMSRAAAETMVEHISGCLQNRDTCSIALSGGSTPQRLYSLLANAAALRARIPWERIHVFWGDERHVSPGHPDSNYLMAYNRLLSHVPIPPTNIHRIRSENADAEGAAANYELEIQRFFKIRTGAMPRFDFVLLGLGADAHTASLFPGTAALKETKRLVLANWVEKFQAFRFTLTAPVLNSAACILFLVAGKDKATAVKAVLEGKFQPYRYPAQLIQPFGGELIWLMDRSAVRRLTQYRPPT